MVVFTHMGPLMMLPVVNLPVKLSSPVWRLEERRVTRRLLRALPDDWCLRLRRVLLDRLFDRRGDLRRAGMVLP